MFRFLGIPLTAISLAAPVTAQEPVDDFQNLSFGVSVNQFHRDFGVGLNLTSPYWGKKTRTALRLAYNFMYLEHLNTNTETVWTSYRNVQLGILLATKPINEFFRYYGQVGGIVLLPNEEFSSEREVLGIYGLFGFEFLFESTRKLSKSIFIELGAVGTGAKGDLLVGAPIYSNGFVISTGLRLFFRKSAQSLGQGSGTVLR